MNEFTGIMDITVKGCNLYYGDFHALKNINMEIPEKNVTALIGPSGCGKSTFLKIFNRMNDLVEGCRIEGEYRIGGVDVFGKDTDVNVLRKNVGMVFQKPNPFPMSIYDNIAFAPRTFGIKKKSELDDVVESSLRRASIWDEVKDRLHKNALVEMCRLTEQMLSDAITALVNRDRELGKSIGVTDKKVDEYEMAIEKKCMRILLKQQPVAKDFREVSTALKMITDIERFGDQAADIGDLVYTMPGEAYIKKLTHITEMGNLAVRMVRESVNSFINNDEALADSVIALDDRMDELFVTVKNELIELIKKDGANGDQGIELMMVAKYLERIGDHAVNVAEWAKYNETGVHQKF